jgi:hypothetical protein
LGGMATGGLVTAIPNMSDASGKQWIGGICWEWIERLDKWDAAFYPKKNELGSGDPKLVKWWADRSIFVTRLGKVILSVNIDPEVMKGLLVYDGRGRCEAGSSFLGTETIMEGNRPKASSSKVSPAGTIPGKLSLTYRRW